MFAATAGFSTIDSWAAGARRMGIPEPSAFVAYVVTVVSSMPWAIFPIVLAVHGASRSKSALPSRPHISKYSIAPVMAVTTGWPVAYCNAFGWMMSIADRVRTA